MKSNFKSTDRLLYYNIDYTVWATAVCTNKKYPYFNYNGSHNCANVWCFFYIGRRGHYSANSASASEPAIRVVTLPSCEKKCLWCAHVGYGDVITPFASFNPRRFHVTTSRTVSKQCSGKSHVDDSDRSVVQNFRQNKSEICLSDALVPSPRRLWISADMSSPPKERVETKGGHLPAGKAPWTAVCF